MANMAPPAGEELRICDGDVNRATETVAFHSSGEGRGIVLIGISSELVHDNERYTSGR